MEEKKNQPEQKGFFGKIFGVFSKEGKFAKNEK